MRIFLFRHGEILNPRKLCYGRLPDFHLSEKGKKDVQEKALQVKQSQLTIDKIYSSPLERTVETAEIIADVFKMSREEIILDDRLIEAECSKWQGLPQIEVINARKKDPNLSSVETFETCGRRVLRVLKEAADKYSNVAIVSHGDPIMGAIGLLERRKAWTDPQAYISKGKYYLIEVNQNNWSILGLY